MERNNFMDKNKQSPPLWAPWRMEYIRGEKEPGCIFCHKPAQKNDRENLILHRGESVFIIMNKYPYNNGHIMVVPYRHESEVDQLTKNEYSEMMLLVQRTIRALKKLMNPQGFNIGMNVGAAAGAGIDDHLHFHIVPRWNADTNFMPVIGHTKVISEVLDDTWEQLQKIL